jgi:hypothetical protein
MVGSVSGGRQSSQALGVPDSGRTRQGDVMFGDVDVRLQMEALIEVSGGGMRRKGEVRPDTLSHVRQRWGSYKRLQRIP